MDSFWEFLFSHPVIHSEDTDGAIARRLRVTNLVSVPGKIEVSEFGSGEMRSFALTFDHDYTPDRDKLASAGETLPVMLREKKFDFSCRLAIEIESHPRAYARRIFAIFEEIRGNISVMQCYGPVLHGPLISQSSLCDVARFSDCIYEAVETPPPSEDYCIYLPVLTSPRN